MRQRLTTLLVLAVLIASASAACALNWQPDYYGSGLAVSIVYWWTDKGGNRLAGEAGKDHPQDIWRHLCPYSIPMPEYAKDADWTGKWWFFTGNKYCGGTTKALKPGSSGLETDIQGFFQGLGIPELHWPSGFGNGETDVYWGVDLPVYYAATQGQFQPSQNYHIVNGRCAELPGYIFGTTPAYLDPVEGIKTANVIVNTIVTSTAREGLCPEPSSVVVLAGGLGFLGMALRRRLPSK